ncbi:RadC family protein [Propionispora hippei]|uniref:DNA repair protein RadC n=1 Tax=Propionispora hippei DSM 15287 TaxID=1123003 RepID=A0A1M6B4K1_9FIRM|nr:DNA repair protein RadC [Propionispora hippei]SHI43679.1 DNA repair protein RadC [Propionispora hippei DSM 15287]
MTGKLEAKSLMIKELPQEERPREKLLAKGPEALSNAELLAILLRSGTKQDSVMRVAERLLKQYESTGIGAFSNISPQAISKIKGIGMVKAVTIVAAIELGKRLHSSTILEKPVIHSPRDVADLMMSRLRYENKELFMILLLSTKNHVLATPVISVGTLNASLVHPREVFREVIHYPAASVILLHNHPSGDPNPSKDDIALTKKLIDAGKILDISVLDHVIIGDNKYVSLKEKGII